MADPKVHTCETCGKSFTSPNRKKANRFCSLPCYWESMRGTRQTPPKKCEWCGKEYYASGSNRKFCSHPCYIESIKKPKFPQPTPEKARRQIPRTACEHCGKEFYGRKKRRTDGYRSGIYCSVACRRAAHRKKVRHTCEQCGETFEAAPSSNRRFCSYACYWESLKNGGHRPCAQCGRKVYRRRSEIENRKFIFCSNECTKAYFTGEQHPMYKDGTGRMPRGSNWKSQRKKALRRDKHTCRRCGTHEDDLSDEQWRLEVHHTKPYKDFESHKQANRLNNLVTLCHKCHVEAESANDG